jgi:hypothetical protein
MNSIIYFVSSVKGRNICGWKNEGSLHLFGATWETKEKHEPEIVDWYSLFA